QRMLDRVEAEGGVRVVIAAHPRADYADRSHIFGDREIVRGETAALVRDADLVLAHCSTAVNFAALERKPVLFLTSDSLERHVIHGSAVPVVAGLFSKTPVNIDHVGQVDWQDERTVDGQAYDSYIAKYIKAKGTPERLCWDLVADYLRTFRSHP
ncbi:MAG: hypothetical protein ABI837_04315, partial [Acidobacteriota bacterium]